MIDLSAALEVTCDSSDIYVISTEALAKWRYLLKEYSPFISTNYWHFKILPLCLMRTAQKRQCGASKPFHLSGKRLPYKHPSITVWLGGYGVCPRYLYLKAITAILRCSFEPPASIDCHWKLFLY